MAKDAKETASAGRQRHGKAKAAAEDHAEGLRIDVCREATKTVDAEGPWWDLYSARSTSATLWCRGAAAQDRKPPPSTSPSSADEAHHLQNLQLVTYQIRSKTKKN